MFCVKKTVEVLDRLFACLSNGEGKEGQDGENSNEKMVLKSLVVQLKTELAAVVDVLCVLHDFIDTSFGSNSNSFVRVTPISMRKLSAQERRRDTFSEWPDNVPVVVEDDPLSLHNFAAKCEVTMEADEEGPLDFLEDELNTMNPDPLAINAIKNPTNNRNAQPKPRPGPSSKKVGQHVILPSPRVSSSSFILINEDDEADEDDRRPRSNKKQPSSLSRVLDITSAACVRARIPMRPASKITFNTSTLSIDLR
ncbi:hypothetical protein Ocin01_19924 [Orchesella cincta]|uniref:Uncharacterized protein n=1 Tax=Orchesella cincta TaxID=48709 RepID=A0A1D2M1B6_ORCCI|nr:hypothetical protein Ocin01_19924 [Orchesella cincta]